MLIPRVDYGEATHIPGSPPGCARQELPAHALAWAAELPRATHALWSTRALGGLPVVLTHRPGSPPGCARQKLPAYALAWAAELPRPAHALWSTRALGRLPVVITHIPGSLCLTSVFWRLRVKL